MFRFHHPGRRAFTLVELLVVVTIVAILIALLLPAVQAAREAGRQAQCQNNMRQLGLACLNYESQNGWFPPSASYPKSVNPSTTRVQYGNWVIAILPFLEQQALFDTFDLSVPISDSRNRTARGTDLQVMRCPTDVGQKAKFSSPDSTNTEGDNWARGNYAANASLAHYWLSTYCGAGTTGNLSYSRWHRGIMGANLSLGVPEVSDGTSNTILLAEVRTGLVAQDRRGTWALQGPGASALWAHGWTDANGPNPCSTLSDDIADCAAIQTNVGGSTALRTTCMTCFDSNGAYDFNGQAATRSQHQGGVFATFADGGVRFISNYIEKSNASYFDQDLNGLSNNPANFLCWQRLCASQDGQVVDGKKF